MELKLNIYSKERNQETGKKEIVKTYTTDEYDLMYGTVEDIISLFDGVDLKDQQTMLAIVNKFMGQLKPLLKDVFFGLTDEELRNIKVSELVPIVVNIFQLAMGQFNNGSKNLMGGLK